MNTETCKPLPLNDLNSVNTLWLSQVLSYYYDSDCVTSTYEMEPTCVKEGYLSEIAYISVSFNLSDNDRKEYLVIKCLPNTMVEREFVMNGKLAEREVDFYKFSQSEEFKTVVIKSGLSLIIPDVLYSEFEDSCFTIVMKNLRTLNYKTLMLRDGSTLEHTLRAFSSIAVVHAAGLYYFQKHDNYGLKKYDDNTFLDKILESNIEKLSKIFKGDPLSVVFQKLIPLSKIICSYPSKHPLFETIIHGDLWAGQSMFSEDEKEICILDWQFSTVGNPVVDLMGMFFMSSDPYILEHNLDEILEHYWRELTNNLEKNNVSFTISYSDFVKCVERHWMTGFSYIATSLRDFMGANNISDKRLRGLMIFLHKRNVFNNFIEEFQSSDKSNSFLCHRP